MTIFSSSVLGEVQHPINILREYLHEFGNKCQAAILSWLDNWTRTKNNQGKPTWIYLTLEGLATELGYHKKTIHKHLHFLLDMGFVTRRAIEQRRFPTDTSYEYQIVLEAFGKKATASDSKSDCYQGQNAPLGDEKVPTNIDTTQSPFISLPQGGTPGEKKKGDFLPDDNKPENTNPPSNSTEHTVPPQNPGGETLQAPRPVKKSIENDNQTKEVWEVALGHPFPVFVNWHAKRHYEPQGGKWEANALSFAYSEFYKNRQKTTAVLFPQFLAEMKTITENCNQQLHADIKALLPSYFISLPDATQENVQQLMNNLQQLIEKGVEVALPQGIATSSCNQSMTFASATGSDLKALPTLEQPSLPSAPIDDLQRQIEHAQKMWENPRQQPQVRAWVKRTNGVRLGESGPELDSEFEAPWDRIAAEMKQMESEHIYKEVDGSCLST